jgi:hypothetical protein
LVEKTLEKYKILHYIMPKVIETNINNNNFFSNIISFISAHLDYLNSSKFFAGIVMILLNVGSKFITIQFSRSAEEYLKYSVSKQILIFAMAWMGTRDIVTALTLTAIFVILSEYLFNEESNFCVVPQHYRVLNTLVDVNDDGNITKEEIDNAISILDKANKQKQLYEQKKAYKRFKESEDIIHTNYY